MGVPLVSGRYLNDFDVTAAERVYVVSERLAQRMFPGQDAAGRRVKAGALDSTSKWGTIAGVVRDVKHDALTGDGGLDLYSSYQQLPDANMYVLLRAASEPLALAEPATRVVWSLDPDQSTFNLTTMERRIAGAIWQRRVSGALFVIFALLALALAAIGIYGVMSYATEQRTREIGVRLAMGAQTRDVLRLVIGQGARLIALGLGAGLVVAFAVTRLMTSLLYQVSAVDPMTFALAPLLLAAVALAACYLPARRATKVDPIVALKCE
jgi:putative ABC transport system permease protein